MKPAQGGTRQRFRRDSKLDVFAKGGRLFHARVARIEPNPRILYPCLARYRMRQASRENVMYTVYKLNADELNEDFLKSIKSLFHNKIIEIAVCEADTSEQDETAYLLGNPANRQRLLQAIENVRQGRDLVEVDLNAP